MADEDIYTQFMGTLDVINKALDAHKDDSPWKQLLGITEKAIGSKRIGVGVYADDPAEPFDYFTVRLTNDKFELVARGKDKQEIPWRVSRDYLAKVNAQPQKYIEHPMKLDWDWLMGILPDSARALFTD